MSDIVIITDIGAVDPDDTFAIIMLPELIHRHGINVKGIITTHIYPARKAKMLKLILTEIGLGYIPVYVGCGVEYGTEYCENDRENWLKSNELFPSLFGYPKTVCTTEKEWFPNFMKGYHDNYSSDYIESMPIEKISGYEFLTKTLQNYDEKNKLTVIELAPMHDLANLPIELYQRMDLFAMGGWLSTIGNDINKLGYNWGICPGVTRSVLQNLTASGTTLTVIGSDFVRQNNVSIPAHIYHRWTRLMESKPAGVPVITKAIMADWNYSLKGNSLTQHKNICDPLTLYLAIVKKYMVSNCNLTMNNEIKVTNYLQEQDGIMTIENRSGNIKLVNQIDANTTQDMLLILDNILFPKTLSADITKILSGAGPVINGNTYYCVNNDTDIAKLKETIASSGQRIVQIVGDCVPYPTDAADICLSCINLILKPDDILEYGVTGSKKEDGSCDINQIVSDLIDAYEYDAIGNLVDYHSLMAIEKWNCTYSKMCNKYTLYRDNGHAKFGDDVKVTDGLCDMLICADGGIQSFCQIINCLMQNKPVYCMSGLRSEENNKYFSAAGFLLDLKNKKDILGAEMDVLFSKYMEDKILFNKSRPDADTKESLFKAAWTNFMEHELWTKLNLVNTLSIQTVSNFI